MAGFKFDTTAEVAKGFDHTPGKWLVKVPREVTLGNKPPRPGVETLDQYGNPRATKDSKIPMWTVAAEVIDDHPAAPSGAYILGINLVQGGKGMEAVNAFLKALGHPVDQWKRETDPAKVPTVTEEFIYERPFVLATKLNDKGYLEPDGFMPYYSKEHPRGPATAGRTARGGNGSRAGGSGAAAGAGAGAGSAGGGAPAAGGGTAKATGTCPDCPHPAHRPQSCTPPCGCLPF